MGHVSKEPVGPVLARSLEESLLAVSKGLERQAKFDCAMHLKICAKVKTRGVNGTARNFLE